MWFPSEVLVLMVLLLFRCTFSLQSVTVLPDEIDSNTTQPDYGDVARFNIANIIIGRQIEDAKLDITISLPADDFAAKSKCQFHQERLFITVGIHLRGDANLTSVFTQIRLNRGFWNAEQSACIFQNISIDVLILLNQQKIFDYKELEFESTLENTNFSNVSAMMKGKQKVEKLHLRMKGKLVKNIMKYIIYVIFLLFTSQE